MSNIYKGEFQDYEGNVVYPHTSADVVFATDGQTIQKKLNDAEIDYTDVKAQLTSGEHEFRFGITADGEYGYHKEVDGADTVVPFKNKSLFHEQVISLNTQNNTRYVNFNIDKGEYFLTFGINYNYITYSPFDKLTYDANDITIEKIVDYEGGHNGQNRNRTAFIRVVANKKTTLRAILNYNGQTAYQSIGNLLLVGDGEIVTEIV